MKPTYFLVLSMCFVSCAHATAPQIAVTPETHYGKGDESIDAYIASWSKMGMWLPDREQIRYFRDNFEPARASLRKALSDSNRSVRLRAAYVIGEIGGTAKPAGQDLLDRLAEEPDRLVRLYIVSALSETGYDPEATASVLRDRYETLDGTNVPPKADHTYAEVDEKIAIAAALYTLVGEESKEQYYDFVVKWLDPPEDDVDGELLEGYWERRWIAVNSLEQMPTAAGAIPKLESLRAEANAKSWVNIHVPRVLAVLRDNAR